MFLDTSPIQDSPTQPNHSSPLQAISTDDGRVARKGCNAWTPAERSVSVHGGWIKGKTVTSGRSPSTHPSPNASNPSSLCLHSESIRAPHRRDSLTLFLQETESITRFDSLSKVAPNCHRRHKMDRFHAGINPLISLSSMSPANVIFLPITSIRPFSTWRV